MPYNPNQTSPIPTNLSTTGATDPDVTDPNVADPDVIVVGGGHNGLICATYLAKAGMSTLLLEARPDVGGCAATVSALDARFNICNCDHTLVRVMPFIEELDLSSHGLDYLSASPAYVHAFHDNSAPWLFFSDTERTIESIARNRPQAALAYRRYLADALPVAELLLEITTSAATTPKMLSRLLRRRGRGATRLLRWSRASASSVLESYFGDASGSDTEALSSEAMLMPAISTGPTVWGTSPDLGGTGMAAALYALRHLVPTGRPIGGSGALTDALHSAFTAAGGMTLCNSIVESLLTNRNNSIAGVRLTDGTEIRASTVVTAVDPAVVLSQWLPQTSTDPGTASRTSEIDRLISEAKTAPDAEGYESKIDAVISAIPEYQSLENFGLLDLFEGNSPAESTYVICPSRADLEQAHKLRPQGRVATRPTMISNVPSVLDPSMMTADGNHVLSLETLFTPYSLAGGWQDSPEPQRWLDQWAELVQPNFTDSVLRWRAMTPDRYEKELFLHRGHAPSYAGSAVDSMLGRQKHLSRYETPIQGLFLSGAGTFPGAGVWGASGRNTASAVLRARC